MASKNLFKTTSTRIKGTLVFFLVGIALGSFVYTQFLIEKIREKERSSIELWARAMEYNSKQHYFETRRDLDVLIGDIESVRTLNDATKRRWIHLIQRAQSDLSNASLDFVASELIIKNRFDIPSIVVNDRLEVLHSRNTGSRELGKSLVFEYEALNPPIRIMIGDEAKSQEQYVYYGDSGLIRTLQFFPYVQFGLLTLFLGMGYLSLSSIKRNEQSSLWVGMAKEAAHQLGTPLSSLYGWIALIKDQVNDQETMEMMHQISKDVQRIQTVADRFGKIGSTPELKPRKVSPVIRQVIDYLERRMPQLGKHVELQSDLRSDKRIPMNPELFAWAIENLLKNSLDAVDSREVRPRVFITSRHQNGQLIIDVSDNGRGIEKKFHEEIFSPGYSTKKRGWGLGLSLTRRIVEQYHKGRIFVHSSSPGQGTTFRMIFSLSDDLSNGEKRKTEEKNGESIKPG